MSQEQGFVKGAKLCLNPYFLAGWKSVLAGCRSTLSMSKINVRISETKYRSFYNTLIPIVNKKMMNLNVRAPFKMNLSMEMTNHRQ